MMSEKPEVLEENTRKSGMASAQQPDAGQALLSLVDKVFGDTPETEWDKLPPDLSDQHDH